tara:strand:- start:58 stop:249 length:192 start_codon:yes stop_codon:yes gene_type:complete
MHNDLWDNHVQGLTNQVALLLNKMEMVEGRLDYYEQVLITLITALKQGGVIVEDSDGEHEMPS